VSGAAAPAGIAAHARSHDTALPGGARVAAVATISGVALHIHTGGTACFLPGIVAGALTLGAHLLAAARIVAPTAMLRVGLLVHTARATLLEPGTTPGRAHPLIADFSLGALVVARPTVIGVALENHAPGAARVERHRARALTRLANLP